MQTSSHGHTTSGYTPQPTRNPQPAEFKVNNQITKLSLQHKHHAPTITINAQTRNPHPSNKLQNKHIKLSTYATNTCTE
eukprot:gene13114-8960_t